MVISITVMPPTDFSVLKNIQTITQQDKKTKKQKERLCHSSVNIIKAAQHCSYDGKHKSLHSWLQHRPSVISKTLSQLVNRTLT